MKNIKTKQEFHNLTNPKSKQFVIGLDAGYSSMKVFHENGYFCFPSSIRKKPKEVFGFPSETDILYQDLQTGESYYVGLAAQKMTDGTNDTEGELFSRKRYSNKSFHILCNVAIALALRYKKDNREVILQTGLPIAYVEGDKSALIKSLSKPAKFALSMGGKPLQNFEFCIREENIFIMSQPSGSLYSSIMRKDGKYTDDAVNILSQNTLVIDPGFGTLDFLGIKANEICHKGTIDNLGMKEVLTRVSEKILKEFGEDIKVPALQGYLETCKITSTDDESWSAQEHSIEPIIEECVQSVCLDAMNKLKSETSTFRNYQYIIIGGGTGAAWYVSMNDKLKNFSFKGILKANRNDESIGLLYANARGYYLYRRALSLYY